VFVVQRLVELQNEAVARWHVEDISCAEVEFESLVMSNHAINFRLWHEEDKARDAVADDCVIANVKRAIDQLNQQRNDSIERMDEAIAEAVDFQGTRTPVNCPLNTETPGSAIDRLSILALRIYHLDEQVAREGLDEATRHRVCLWHQIAVQQQSNLMIATQTLIDDIFAGRKRHQTFRQLKMYNDPSLNPVVYSKR
jgi:hypothetical protein